MPDEIGDFLSIGSIVRVPLAGRRVRGYVVDIGDGDVSDLKDIRSVSGAWPSFTQATLQTLRWAANHYVAPLSVLIAKTTPPNLSRRAGLRRLSSIPPMSSPVPLLTAAGAAGKHGRATQLLAGANWHQLIRASITDVVRAGRSVMVVAPTTTEAMRLADELSVDFGARIVEVADQSDAALTTAWSVAAAQPGVVVIGTARVVWWPIARLSMVVLLEDGRRGMKERQTPSVAVGAVARRRSAIERFPVLHIGRVPTTEVVSEGVAIQKVAGRLWPLVEVIDRTEEPPGGGVVTQRSRAAVAAAVRRGQRVLVFTHRRGYAPASRCASCRQLRTCDSCDARPDPGVNCTRCGAVLGPCRACGGRRFEPLGAGYGRVVEELRRVVGNDVGGADDERPVTVGTERDLVGLDPVDLAVAVDADGLVRGTNYRAGEDALALLARVAAAVSSGQGKRLVVQTADPGHPIFSALRRGEPEPYLRDELVIRTQLGLPPVGEVIVVEVTGTDDHSPLDGVFDGVSAFGPAAVDGRWRWLIQGPDLSAVRPQLAVAAGKFRDRGVKVRIDVDPRSL